MKGTSFFNNKYVLYILSFLGMINFVGYVALEDYNSMALFVVLLLLSRYFSKSWSLNILISILVSSIVSMNNKIREGFKEGNRNIPRKQYKRETASRQLSKGPSKRQVVPTFKKETATKQSLKGVSKRHVVPTLKKEGENPIKEKPVEEKPVEEKPKEEEKKPVEEKPKDKEEEKEEEKEKPKEDGESCKAEVECASGGCNEGICGPPKSKFTNNVPSSSPSAVNGEDEEDTNVAAKMEDAYNSMNQLLGDGAMKSMAKETKNLVNQQKELMSTLNSMTPALNNAKETLAGLNLPSIEKMTGILKKFNQ